MIVRNHRLAALRVPLDPPRLIGQGAAHLTVPLPSGWQTRHEVDGIVCERAEDERQPARRLIIRRRRCGPRSPMEFLLSSGEWRTAFDACSPISIAGWPGTLVQSRQRSRSLDGRMQTLQTFLAATVIPNGDAVLLRLEAFGGDDASDQDLLRRIAGSLRFPDLPGPSAADGPWMLAMNIGITLGPGFLAMRQADPFRQGQTFLSNTDSYLAVDVAPAIFLNGDGSETFSTMIACRRPWAAAPAVQQLDARTWIARSGNPDGAWAANTYLLTNPDGRALLLECRGRPSAVDEFDRGFAPLARNVTFNPWPELSDRLAEGEKFSRIINRAKPELIRQLPPRQRWLWFVDFPGYTPHYSDENMQRGLRTTTQTLLDGSIISIVRKWRFDSEARFYQHELLLGDNPNPIQTTSVDGPTLHTSITPANAPPAQYRASAWPQFMPGILLPAALGTSPAQPLLLRTESTIIAENAAAIGPITLMIEPTEDMPRYLNDSATPLRCYAVSIAGSGVITRWYFSDDSRLRYIVFPGGAQLQREEVENP